LNAVVNAAKITNDSFNQAEVTLPGADMGVTKVIGTGININNLKLPQVVLWEFFYNNNHKYETINFFTRLYFLKLNALIFGFIFLWCFFRNLVLLKLKNSTVCLYFRLQLRYFNAPFVERQTLTQALSISND